MKSRHTIKDFYDARDFLTNHILLIIDSIEVQDNHDYHQKQFSYFRLHFINAIRKEKDYAALALKLFDFELLKNVIIDCFDRTVNLFITKTNSSEKGFMTQFNHTTFEVLRLHTLKVLKNEAKIKKGSICFFYPTDAFRGNFGYIPEQLDKLDFNTLELVGQPRYIFESAPNPKIFLIIDDMLSKIDGVYAIVCNTIIKGFPTGIKNILIDHISFAKFDDDSLIEKLCGKDIDLDETMSETNVQTIFTAFISHFPCVDLFIVPSIPIKETVIQIGETLGYNYGIKQKQINLTNQCKKHPNIRHIWRNNDINRFKKNQTIGILGYPKLDHAISLCTKAKIENIIIYAPTPNDASGNKEGSEWQDYISINSHGQDIIQTLCSNFKNFKIIFKPHKDEFQSVTDKIDCVGRYFDNYLHNRSGSDYWELYSKSMLLISDFSSTAYTFALGSGRPVVFFSPNEAKIPNLSRLNQYCQNRNKVGLIATSLVDLVDKTREIVDNYNYFRKLTKSFQKKELYNPGNSSKLIAEAIVDYVEGNYNESFIEGLPPIMDKELFPVKSNCK